MTTRPEVVALIADCLRHCQTQLIWDDAPDWTHEDSRPVTPEEGDTLRFATLGEIRAALDLFLAETNAQLPLSLGEPATILEGKRS